MIFICDFVTRENHWQITSLVTKKSLFTVTHALFYIFPSVFNDELHAVFVTHLYTALEWLMMQYGFIKWQGQYFTTKESLDTRFILRHTHHELNFPGGGGVGMGSLLQCITRGSNWWYLIGKLETDVKKYENFEKRELLMAFIWFKSVLRGSETKRSFRILIHISWSSYFHDCPDERLLLWKQNLIKTFNALLSSCSSLKCATFIRHDYVIKWRHLPPHWPFVWGIHRSLVNSPHKGLWRGSLMFSLICAWINDWVNNREACDLRRHRAHCDVIVMIVVISTTSMVDKITFFSCKTHVSAVKVENPKGFWKFLISNCAMLYCILTNCLSLVQIMDCFLLVKPST